MCCVCLLVCAVWCMCRESVGCAFCVLVLWCAVLCRYVSCWCWCVCVVCAVCAVWCVCVLCVARLGTRKNPVCRFKTSPCVHSKHGDVLNLHTGSLSVSPLLLSFSRPFFFLSSFVLFLFSPLPVTMTMITHSVGSLCTQSSDLPECQSACALGIPCLANMFASCKKQLSWYNCASLVPLGMKWACICAGNECCVWLCVGGVWLC